MTLAEPEASLVSRAVRWVCRPIPAVLVVLAIYSVLMLAMDPGGYLGTDTGAKVATLEVMDERGTVRPGLGYWAARWDPTGALHPIYDALPVDGDWVHVTTLPMLELARPLYAVGGYRATLLLPMLGALGAAFGARSLARRSHDDGAGWQAFFVVGLASPLVVYALDFWEHAPGVGCIVAAAALLAGVIDGERPVPRSVGAGLLLGLAATMRTEAFVYTGVLVGVACLWRLAATRRWRPPLETGLAAVIGFAVPWFANQLLERAVGGTDRGGRASGAASGGLSNLADRAWEVLITTLALRGDTTQSMVLVGGTIVLGVVLAVRLASGDRPALVAAALVVPFALVALVAVDDLGFVPGLLMAAPLAIVALTGFPTNTTARYLWVVAVLALPLVWAFQFLGGAFPQWGGRYTLASSTLLVVVGLLATLDRSRVLRLGVVALSVLVTATGVLWLRDRSTTIDAAFDRLVHRPEDVIIVRNGFFIREGGATYTERRWLNAVTDEDLVAAVEVVAEAGFDTFAVLDDSVDAPARLGGATFGSTAAVPIPGGDYQLHTYTFGLADGKRTEGNAMTNMRSQVADPG